MGVIVVGRDIDYRKKMELELKKSEELFRMLSEASPIGVFNTDDIWNIQYYNKQILEITGLSNKDIKEGKWIDAVHPDDRERISEEWQISFREKGGWAAEFRVVTPDEKIRWVYIKTTPAYTENGEFKGQVGTVVDITDRVRSNIELNKSRERYKALFQKSPIAIMIINTEGILINVNPAHKLLTGYSAEELIGLHFSDLPGIIKKDIPSYKGISPELMMGRVFNNMEVQIAHKNGSIVYAEIDIAPVRSGADITNLQILIRDVSERRKSQAALEKSLTEKEVLLRELQHRVKNNLNVISSLLNMEYSKLTDEQSRKVFTDARSRIQTMSRIYEQLYQSPELDKIDLRRYIERFARSIYEAYVLDNVNITLKTGIEDIKLDLKRAVPVGLILNELMSNALKYAYPEGEKGEIRIDLRRIGDRVEFRVSDDGAGFPQDLSEAEKETMGFVLVRMLTEQIEGTLLIEGERGKGCLHNSFKPAVTSLQD
jgi:PAS domain S-box-containing protein